MTDPAEPALRGELRDELVRAMQRVPELAGRDLTLTAAVRRHHEPQLPRRRVAGTADRYVIRLAGNDTHLLGISREVEHAATVAAAGVGVGPEVTAFIRPEGYLVTRFIEGSPVPDEAVHRPETLAPGRRLAAPDPRRPGDPGPVRPAPDRRGLPRARRCTGRPDPAGVRAGRRDRPADRARAASPTRSSCGRATTTC